MRPFRISELKAFLIVFFLLTSHAVVSPVNALMAFSAIECFDLSELSLIATEPNDSGGSVIILDSAGSRHRVKRGEMVAKEFVSLITVLSEGITVSKPVQDINGDWYEMTYDWKIKGKPIQRPMPKSFVPPPPSKPVPSGYEKYCLPTRSGEHK